MSSLTPKNGVAWSLLLTPDTVLTLGFSENQKAGNNTLVLEIPGTDTAGTSIDAFGIAVTSGAPGRTADPVTPVVNASPTAAGAPGDPEITGKAIWAMTLRAPEWKFRLAAAAPTTVLVRAFLAFDVETGMSGADQAIRRIP